MSKLCTADSDHVSPAEKMEMNRARTTVTPQTQPQSAQVGVRPGGGCLQVDESFGGQPGQGGLKRWNKELGVKGWVDQHEMLLARW